MKALHNTQRLLMLLAATTLSACSMFSPVKSNYTEYVINAMPDSAGKGYGRGTLYIAPITAAALYDTDQMAYTNHLYQVEYFAKNKWAEPPTKMLQPLVLQTLQKTHYFHAVTSATTAVNTDYVLNIELLELRQIFTTCSSYVIVKVNAEMINTSTGRIIASKKITTQTPAHYPTPFSGVIAANQATAAMLAKLAAFTRSAAR